MIFIYLYNVKNFKTLLPPFQTFSRNSNGDSVIHSFFHSSSKPFICLKEQKYDFASQKNVPGDIMEASGEGRAWDWKLPPPVMFFVLTYC